MDRKLPRFVSLAFALPLTLIATIGCIDRYPPDTADPDTGAATAAITTAEGFEAGTKTAYAVADVALDSGTWTMDEALVGTSTSDIKTGTRSGRIRNSGRITMKFDRAAGAGTVTIHHASFGTDTSGTWGLFASQNGGASFTQVGTSRSTTGGAFSTATFTVNLAGNIRFEIRKLDGGTNRINIDDITITDFTSGGGGTGAALSKHTTLGIPSPTSTSDPNSFLSVKSGYVISYNSGRKVPNWVSWELNTSYLGSVARQDDFRPDDTLPASLPQASLADYSGSGYDRGHMCPSADRTLTTTANSQTFFLTNMVPQAANNNRGPWADLETEARNIAQTGKELFIISGGTFSATSNSIGTGVVVPDKTFKVIVVLDAVGQGPGSVTSNTRVIGVMMPNENNQISATADWHSFRVSVDAIEAATGFDFLSDVDPAVQAIVESRVDNL
ncbi:MAG TPA: DNA/RNA non-specific endonuclease [Kofleriaceae bacterium]|nr:DNA/RNA non-specific endonuclease [Kofleriaceae bacterium]